jgi:hypothetical protein
MVKAFGAFFSCYLITLSCIAGAQPADCEKSSKFDKNLSELETVAEIAEECPAPTRNQFTRVCNSIYERKKAPEGSKFGDKYQEDLWEISCADPTKDSPELANSKIQKMWNNHREDFRCYGYTGVTVADSNVAKFSADTGFPAFLIVAVKKYKLDMNFKDPADGQTLMDFLQENINRYKGTAYTGKTEEYEKLYKMMAQAGAKHSKDL